MSFAVGCGMHRLSLGPGEGAQSFDASILPPCESRAEMIERINVFGSVFQVGTIQFGISVVYSLCPLFAFSTFRQIERRAVVESGTPTVILDQVRLCVFDYKVVRQLL
jgi:hypothetical protein